MERIKSNLAAIIFIVLGLAAIYISYDILFSKPAHQQGVILEKIYVPGRSATDATPYGGVSRGRYSVTVQKVEQWIAIVKMENGDTLLVHCHPDHYELKNVGEVIHFKKYEGEHLHIKYFAHNEQEE